MVQNADDSVGRFFPNTFGFHDMSDKVYEWTCSAYKKSYDGSEQECAVSAEDYSLRGGSWSDGPGSVRAADRSYNVPDDRLNDIGPRSAGSCRCGRYALE